MLWVLPPPIPILIFDGLNARQCFEPICGLLERPERPGRGLPAQVLPNFVHQGLHASKERVRIASQRRPDASRLDGERGRDRASDYRSGGCAQEGVSSGDVHGVLHRLAYEAIPRERPWCRELVAGLWTGGIIRAPKGLISPHSRRKVGIENPPTVGGGIRHR